MDQVRELPHDGLEEGTSEANWRVCPKCQHHFRLNADAAAWSCCSIPGWVEYDAGLASNDPLHFTDTRLVRSASERCAQKILGMADAIITAEGLIAGRPPVILCSMEFNSSSADRWARWWERK